MKGQRIGYVRVSTFDQNVDRQLEGQSLDRTFTDKASGKDVNRPQLEALLTFAREGDTVVVHSMDRLARNLDDLRKLVQGLTKRGIRIEFEKESLRQLCNQIAQYCNLAWLLLKRVAISKLLGRFGLLHIRERLPHRVRSTLRWHACTRNR